MQPLLPARFTLDQLLRQDLFRYRPKRAVGTILVSEPNLFLVNGEPYYSEDGVITLNGCGSGTVTVTYLYCSKLEPDYYHRPENFTYSRSRKKYG